MLSGGHQVVSGSFRGGGGEYGGGYLQKAVLGHSLAQGGHHIAAENDILLHGGVSQIQIAVAQALSLVGLTAAVDLKGQLIIAALTQNFDLFRNHFNVAGGLLGVLAGSLTNNAVNGNGGFLVYALDLSHEFLVLNDHLGGAVKVTDYHKGEVAAHLTDVLHPANYADLFTNVLNTQLIAGMCTVLCHFPVSSLFPVYSLMTAPLLRAATAADICSAAAWGLSFTCSPLPISLTDSRPSFISSSPTSTTKGMESLSA